MQNTGTYLPFKLTLIVISEAVELSKARKVILVIFISTFQETILTDNELFIILRVMHGTDDLVQMTLQFILD